MTQFEGPLETFFFDPSVIFVRPSWHGWRGVSIYIFGRLPSWHNLQTLVTYFCGPSWLMYPHPLLASWLFYFLTLVTQFYGPSWHVSAGPRDSSNFSTLVAHLVGPSWHFQKADPRDIFIYISVTLFERLLSWYFSLWNTLVTNLIGPSWHF